MTLSQAWLQAPIQQLDIWSSHLAQPLRVGRLNYEVASRAAFFEWSDEAQRLHLNLSPLMVPLSEKLWSSRAQRRLPPEYQGLPGFLNDALPDGWGLYLMDHALARQGIRPELITPATRLAYLGDRAWGSLSFRPVLEDHPVEAMSLDMLGRQMQDCIAGHLEDVSNQLLHAGSSPQGARPKLMLDCDEAFHYARPSMGPANPGEHSWLIKFAARDEPADAPLMEQVYMDSARSAGLTVMDSRVLELNGKPAFATRRFDRGSDGRIYCHTLGGLLHHSHRAAGLDYANLAQVLDQLQVPGSAYREAYTRAVFNAAMSVRDDHAKNFAFVLSADKPWGLSPAYDLTYMPGPGGYHTMSFAGGDQADPRRSDLLKLATYFHLDRTVAKPIIQAQLEVARQVAPLARGLGVGKATLAPIERRLQEIARTMLRG